MIGLVNTRCSRCGCLVTDHDVDDEERRGCQECECDQFEAPHDPVLGGELGTLEWWRSPGFMIQGPADTILRLLEQEEISRRKALELLAYLHCGAPQDLRHALPPAPWDKLNWCDDQPPGSERATLLLCRRAVEAVQAHRECGQQPTLDPGGSGEYQQTRRNMEQALAAAVAALTSEVLP